MQLCCIGPLMPWPLGANTSLRQRPPWRIQSWQWLHYKFKELFFCLVVCIAKAKKEVMSLWLKRCSAGKLSNFPELVRKLPKCGPWAGLAVGDVFSGFRCFKNTPEPDGNNFTWIILNPSLMNDFLQQTGHMCVQTLLYALHNAM